MGRDATRHASRWPERAEQGATMPEYALMSGLIMVVCVGAVLLFGQAVNLLFVSFPN